MPLMNFCIYAGLIAIYAIGSAFIVKSNEELLKLTELQSFMTYSFQILMSLMMLSMIMVMVIMSTASAERISEVLREESTIVSPENALTEVKDGSVEFKNVSFKYSEKAERFALENVNLKIESGETIGIIGATGSSKSTLVNLIPRLYDVTDGEVTVGGVNVKNYDLETLRNSVSVVLQKNVLFSGTIKENLRWGNENASDDEIEEAARLAQADEFVQRFPDKYDTYIEQGGVNVSGGQKQRISIARVFLKNPAILILDEATSALDNESEYEVAKSLEKLSKGRTTITIAHRLSSIRNSDRILVLTQEGIAEEGNHEALMEKKGIYYQFYTMADRLK